MKLNHNIVSRLVVLAAVAGLVGCSTPRYSQRDSAGTVALENVARYGSIAGGTAGGYFAGKELGGSTGAGVAGAGAGLVLTYGANKVIDWFRGRAYDNGVIEGGNQARAEILTEKWKREAVYGITDENSKPQQTKMRRVYVPPRVINGVELAGGYQSVEVAYP